MIWDTFFFEVVLIERIELTTMDSWPDGKGSHVSNFVVVEVFVEHLIDTCAVEVIRRDGEVGWDEEVLELVGGHCCFSAEPEEGHSP